MSNLDLYSKGVQALCDLGVKEIPEEYIQPECERADPQRHELVQGKLHELPVIDLSRLHEVGRRSEVIEEIKSACEWWGFFYIVNHGFPESLMNAMMEVGRQFFQLPAELKMRFFQKKASTTARYGVAFNSGEDRVLEWRDFLVHPCHPLSDELVNVWPDVPPHYREVAMDYCRNVRALALKLLALLSESLGLRENFLNESFKGHDQVMLINHYPPCPQPDLTLGISVHTDPHGFTILQQDDVGGLEIFKDGSWYAVNFIPKAFVINMGDQIEILSNGKYKSIEHRAVVNSEKTRFSIATFYAPSHDATIAPVAELIKAHPNQTAKYDKVIYGDYMKEFYSKGLIEKRSLLNSLTLQNY